MVSLLAGRAGVTTPNVRARGTGAVQVRSLATGRIGESLHGIRRCKCLIKKVQNGREGGKEQL